jgi:hypothetical protein
MTTTIVLQHQPTKIIYGNPGKHHMELIENSEVLRLWASKLQPLLHMPYPCDVTTHGEIQYLIQKHTTVTQDDIAYANHIDTNLLEVWSDYIGSFGYVISADQLDQWIAPFDPIIDYLKLHYNRPRPFQIAGQLNLPMYPTVRCGSTDSAYPAGHTLHSLYIYHKLVALHPMYKREWLRMVCDVADTRLDLGVHYPSDNLFSFQVYNHIRPYMQEYLAGYRAT